MQIDDTVHASLTDADKQELEIWQELLDSRGFAQLQKMLAEQSESIQQVIANANNWDAYVYARGQRDSLSLVTNLEAILEHKVNSIAETMQDEAEQSLSDTIDELSVNLDLI